MTIWAIGDLHLSFGCPGKEMDKFGPHWVRHFEKIQKDWDDKVAPDDLVLIPGDISWAMHLEEAEKDLAWIAERPGTKVLIKGNHDYWWHSLSKIRKILPPSIHVLGTDAFHYNDISVCGARLWDSQEYTFAPYILISDTGNEKKAAKKDRDIEEDEKIFQREIGRLALGLQALHKDAKIKIVLTHYPPISADLADSTVSKMVEAAGVHHVIFGHLHNVHAGSGEKLFGVKNDVNYQLTSCDFLNFSLLRIIP